MNQHMSFSPSQILIKYYNIEIVKTIQLPAFEADLNFKLEGIDGTLYILKISIQKQIQILSKLSQLMQFINHQLKPYQIHSPSPIFSIHNTIIVTLQQHKDCYVRLFNFIEGTMLFEHGYQGNQQLYYNFGCAVGVFDKIIAEYPNTQQNYFSINDSIWNLYNARNVEKYIQYIPDNHYKMLISNFLDDLKNINYPHFISSKISLTHGDLHNENTIVNAKQKKIVGIIDFDEVCLTYPIFDLCIAMASSMHDFRNSISTAIIVLKGFNNVKPITDNQLKILYYGICARTMTQIVMGQYQHFIDPSNQYAKSGIQAIYNSFNNLIQMGPSKVQDLFLQAIKN